MKLSSVRMGAVAILGAMSLTACDAGNVLLWPWVDITAKEEAIPADPGEWDVTVRGAARLSAVLEEGREAAALFTVASAARPFVGILLRLD